MSATMGGSGRTGAAGAMGSGGGASTAVLGGGCFWCLEAVFQSLKGVTRVTSGYAGGTHPAPTYREVCEGTTGHAEVVRVEFNAAILPYRTLLDVFFTIHDPTTRDQQGNDVGPQYRSIILYDGPAQKSDAEAAIRDVEAEGRWDGTLVTEVKALGTFFPAEKEHDDYYRRNPGNPYCSFVITPKVAKARAKFRSLYRE